jgi:hypothetical protein
MVTYAKQRGVRRKEESNITVGYRQMAVAKGEFMKGRRSCCGKSEENSGRRVS